MSHSSTKLKTSWFPATNIMNCLEPCCYTKQFNQLLYDTNLDVIPVYHSGDIYSSHILERIDILSPKHSTLWIVMPSINEYTMKYIQQTMKRTFFDMDKKAKVPKFNVVNIITSAMPEQPLNAIDGQELNIVIKKNVGFCMIGSTATTPAATPHTPASTPQPQSATPHNPAATQHTPAATVPGSYLPGVSSKPHDNFRVGECLLVTGSIIQTQQPGLHIVEIHRGAQQLEYLIPFVRSQIRIHKKQTS